MVEKTYKVVWTKHSQQQMRQAFEFIYKDSQPNAVKVLEDIVAAVNKAIPNPEFYNPDKYKLNNDGSYRAFEKHSYRISYRFNNGIIRILRVRHTSMEPREF